MQVGYLYDPVFLEHTQENHPENHERLTAIMSKLRDDDVLKGVAQLPFSPATFDQLTKVHDRAYLAALERFCTRGGGMVDMNTYANQASFRAATAASGASIAATRAVMAGDVQRAFALVRPPGHHASMGSAGGFCLMNNVAFAAREALGLLGGNDTRQVQRVAIVDFDVHHGNGTQDIFYADPRILYISTHQSPLFPGTGQVNETGAGEGVGTTVNIPIAPRVGDRGFQRVFGEIITPVLRRFKPELILVSAGYDAHWLDRIYNVALSVSLRGFADMMTTLVRLSNELCEGRMVVVLEGGYDLGVLGQGVANTFYALRDQDERVKDPFGTYPGQETSVDKLIKQVKSIHHL